jgi:hypothetical protein
MEGLLAYDEDRRRGDIEGGEIAREGRTKRKSERSIMAWLLSRDEA